MGSFWKNYENEKEKEKEKQKDKGKEKDYISVEKTTKYINNNPLSIQLKSKLTLVNIEMKNNSYPPYITFIHTLKNNNIGIIFDLDYLSIYSINTFKLIYTIEPKKDITNINININNINFSSIFGFIELKNGDLLLWTSEIIIIYTQINKSYKLLQIINEYEKGTSHCFESTRYGIKEIECYNLNSLHELRNGFVVSCNSYGLKFYSKNNDKYNLISKEKSYYDAENILEIKEDFFILFQKKSTTYRSYCVLSPSSSTTYVYRVSLFNIRDKEEKILIESTCYDDSICFGFDPTFSNIKYIIKDKYLFISFPNLLYIYDISKNIKLIEDEIKIEILCNYYNDLVVVKDLVEKKIKIYEFKDGIFKFYNDFPIQDFRKIFVLNNNNFLIYSDHYLKILEIK